MVGPSKPRVPSAKPLAPIKDQLLASLAKLVSRGQIVWIAQGHSMGLIKEEERGKKVGGV